VYCVLCTVYCVLCTVYCVLCTVYCVLCTVYCVLLCACVLRPDSSLSRQPVDYVKELNGTAWLDQLQALNGNNSTLINAWSSGGTSKLVLRPTHWTDSITYQQLRFAEVLGRVGLIPLGITGMVVWVFLCVCCCCSLICRCGLLGVS
jgi:hypothetical protein